MSRSCQSRSCCLLNVLEIVIDSVMDPTFHVTMSHNASSSERRMPPAFPKNCMCSIDRCLNIKVKAIQMVAHRQCHSRSMSGIASSLCQIVWAPLDNLMSRFVNAPRVLVVWLRLTSLCTRTAVECCKTHADGNRACQGP